MRNRTSEAKERARELRKNMSVSERVFWEILRKERLGAKFRRQVPIGPYFLDFYAPQHKLCVEIDGEQHIDRIAQDVHRDQFLRSLGIRTIRIPSLSFFSKDPQALNCWLSTIERALAK